MKYLIIFVAIVCVSVVDLSAQHYDCHVDKFAFKQDALPYGTMSETNIRIVIDFDSSYIKIFEKEDIFMYFEELQSREVNNGVLKRLGAFWPDGNRCFVHLFLRNDIIESVEIKCLKASFMYVVSQVRKNERLD